MHRSDLVPYVRVSRKGAATAKQKREGERPPAQRGAGGSAIRVRLRSGPGANRSTNGAERATSALADDRNRRQADDDDQREHDGVFDGGLAVLALQKLDDGREHSGNHAVAPWVEGARPRPDHRAA